MPGPRVNTTPARGIARRLRSLGRDKPGSLAPTTDGTLEPSPNKEPDTMPIHSHSGHALHRNASEAA
jgi:hypothetical protein